MSCTFWENIEFIMKCIFTHRGLKIEGPIEKVCISNIPACDHGSVGSKNLWKTRTLMCYLRA